MHDLPHTAPRHAAGLALAIALVSALFLVTAEPGSDDLVQAARSLPWMS